MRWLLGVGVVILAVLLWQLRSEVAAPSSPSDEHAAAQADDKDDDGDADDDDGVTSTTTPTATHRTAHARKARPTPTVKTFDPWADPGPLDPRTPHLDVDDPHEAHLHTYRAFHDALAAVKPQIDACVTKHGVAKPIDLFVGFTVSIVEEKQVSSPYVNARGGVELTPAFEHCVTDVLAQLDVATPEGRSYHLATMVHVD